MLVAIKRDLFPWRFENVMGVELKRTPRADVLVVDNGKAVEHIDLARRPTIAGLPAITRALVQMHGDTQAQRHMFRDNQKHVVSDNQRYIRW